MTPSILFTLCTYGVIPAWLLLALLPKWQWTIKIVQYVWIPALLAIAYVFVLFTKPSAAQGGGFGSLEAVSILLSQPESALLAWLHFLAFDLFVGAWIVRDSTRLEINPLMIAPCLFLTLMFGPMGFLAYSILRLVLRKTFAIKD